MSESCLLLKAGLWRQTACSCKTRRNGSVQELKQKIIKKDMNVSSHNMLCLFVCLSVSLLTADLKDGLGSYDWSPQSEPDGDRNHTRTAKATGAKWKKRNLALSAFSGTFSDSITNKFSHDKYVVSEKYD